MHYWAIGFQDDVDSNNSLQLSLIVILEIARTLVVYFWNNPGKNRIARVDLVEILI